MNDSLRLTIRDAHADDAPVLTQIAIAAKSGWGYTTQLLELWLPQLTISSESIQSRIVYVAELDGEAVGFGGLDFGGDPPEIDDLWVLPDFQFCGVGTSLFRHLCKSAFQRQIERVEIVSDPNAAPFYEHMGAKQIGWQPSKPAGRMLPKFEVVLTSTEFRIA
ncbi:GNAT family N-acetyltransferase [Roseiconus lacunae]|uniref:GNAT family N-acetyltransferase n=1 Tax=Roseiconus lacunae TaxID=2605694 RepID=UPI00308F079C|nr:GNAT family N-acetyltransferase [Stieleria sp. HD01]